MQKESTLLEDLLHGASMALLTAGLTYAIHMGILNNKYLKQEPAKPDYTALRASGSEDINSYLMNTGMIMPKR